MTTTKIKISAVWTAEERIAVAAEIKRRITELEEKERKLRKTILYEAPCFRELRDKRARLQELIEALSYFRSSFLEHNRVRFADFIE